MSSTTAQAAVGLLSRERTIAGIIQLLHGTAGGTLHASVHHQAYALSVFNLPMTRLRHHAIATRTYRTVLARTAARRRDARARLLSTRPPPRDRTGTQS